MDNHQSQSAENKYSKENEELRNAYLERQKRERQATLETMVSTDSRQWKIEEKVQSQNNPFVDRLLLNHLIYDRRKPKPSQYVSINALFNENPHERGIGFNRSHSIESIFMSTFGFETELLEPIAEIGCNFILSNDRSGEETTLRNYNGYPNWTVVFPVKKTKGYSVYHSKLWLIKFKRFLRVVVGTGNLHLGDWSVWANAFWWKDFPPLDKQKEAEKKQEKTKDVMAADFQTTLKFALKFMLPDNFGPKELKFDLDDYNYEGVDVILIPSVPGTYPDEGQLGLGKVKKCMLKYGSKESAKRQMLTCNTTSLGMISEDFLRDVYQCFNPHFQKEFQLSDFKLIYPTDKYIKNETVGAAQTLFLNEDSFRKSPVLRNVLHRYEDNPLNPSGGSIPHLKTIILSSTLDENVTFYIGSHNLTKAAWGAKSTTRSTISVSIDGDKYAFKNTELGLLFPNYNLKKLQQWLPFKFPPARYEPGERPYMRV